MARISKLVIKESVEELRSLLGKQTKSKNLERLNVLIHLQENNFLTREELSNYVGVTRRTIERWLSNYRSGGLKEMLLPEKRNRKSHLIPPEVQEGLAVKVLDGQQGFSSYVEAKNWIEAEYNLELKYNTVREHLIRHFETKIKSPRKSHVKKEKQAIEAFLKTA